VGLPPVFFRLPRFSNSHSLTGDIFGAVIIVILGSSFFVSIANLTTGQTIVRHAFNNATITSIPNPNITGTPGFPAIIQIIPFVFGAMVLIMVYAVFQKRLPGGL